MTQSPWAALLPILSWIECASTTYHYMVTSSTVCMHSQCPSWWGEKTAASTTWLYRGKTHSRTVTDCRCPPPPHVPVVFLNYKSFRMSFCPSGAVLDCLFFVTKLSSWMVLSIITSRLSIHFSTSMELSICWDMTSSFFSLAFISSGILHLFFLTVPNAPNPRRWRSPKRAGLL